MLKCWLKITPGATWDDLIHALRAPSLELLSVADDIEKEVKGWCSYICECVESLSVYP